MNIPYQEVQPSSDESTYEAVNDSTENKLELTTEEAPIFETSINIEVNENQITLTGTFQELTELVFKWLYKSPQNEREASNLKRILSNAGDTPIIISEIGAPPIPLIKEFAKKIQRQEGEMNVNVRLDSGEMVMPRIFFDFGKIYITGGGEETFPTKQIAKDLNLVIDEQANFKVTIHEGNLAIARNIKSQEQ